MSNTGNAIIPTEAEHDEHYAHECCDCGTPFKLCGRRPAGSCKDGDLCQDCLDAREQQTETEQ